MKNPIFRNTLILSVIIMAVFNSCQKEGPVGPAGTDGNANVQSSTVWITTWYYTAPSYYADIYYAAITQDIIDRGAVLVYVETGTNTWSQLPLTFYTSSTYSSTLEVVSSPNNVRIFWTDSDLAQPLTPPTLRFKIVVIAASGMPLYNSLSTKNYETIQETFDLK